MCIFIKANTIQIYLTCTLGNNNLNQKNMINIKQALGLMQDSVNSMQRSGMTVGSILISPDTVILGAGSFLDSLGFVTFISDMEERVSAVSGKDHYFILTDIQDTNSDQAFLSAGALAAYIETITR